MTPAGMMTDLTKRTTTPHDMDEAEIVARIRDIKEEYGNRMVLLGHFRDLKRFGTSL